MLTVDQLDVNPPLAHMSAPRRDCAWLTVVEISDSLGFGFATTAGGERLPLDIFTGGIDICDLEIGIRIYGVFGEDGRVTDVVDP